MTWTKTKAALVVGSGILLALGVTTLILGRHSLQNRLTLMSGRRTITRRLAQPIDFKGVIAQHYGTPASYFDKITAFPAWKTVPRGFQVFDQVPLQIDGMICLWGESNAKKLHIVFPEEVPGIPVNQKFQTLYVYHGAFFTAPSGTPVCDLVFHYEDGSAVTNQLLYGEDILDWTAKNDRKPDGSTGIAGPTGPHSKLAWVGGSFSPQKKAPVRFCLTAIANLQPDLAVTSIDLVSDKSNVAACILAMTAGRAGLMQQ
jgi:hypothetical protein